MSMQSCQAKMPGRPASHLYCATKGSGQIRAHAQHDMSTIGLTACRGDGSRDTVEEKLAILSLSSGGAPDGSRDAPNYLSGRVSGLRAEPSAACPCPARRTGRYAVSHRRARRPYPSVPRRPCAAGLVQLVSASLLPPMHVPPDRALARTPAGAAARL